MFEGSLIKTRVCQCNCTIKPHERVLRSDYTLVWLTGISTPTQLTSIVSERTTSCLNLWRIDVHIHKHKQETCGYLSHNLTYNKPPHNRRHNRRHSCTHDPRNTWGSRIVTHQALRRKKAAAFPQAHGPVQCQGALAAAKSWVFSELFGLKTSPEDALLQSIVHTSWVRNHSAAWMRWSWQICIYAWRENWASC